MAEHVLFQNKESMKFGASKPVMISIKTDLVYAITDVSESSSVKHGSRLHHFRCSWQPFLIPQITFLLLFFYMRCKYISNYFET